MCTGGEGIANAISLFAGAAGTVFQAQGARQQAEARAKMYENQAEAQAKAYEYQAKMHEQNAKLYEGRGRDAVERGREEESSFRAQARRFLASQKAGMGASGVDLSSGSPLAVLGATSEGIEMDAATIRYNAQLERWNALVGAADSRSQGTMAAYSAKTTRKYGADAAANARAAGKLQSSTTLIGGLGQVAGKWYSMGGASSSGRTLSASGSYGGGAGATGFVKPRWSK